MSMQVKAIFKDGYYFNSAFAFDHRDVAHLSMCDDGCLALAELLGWKVKCHAHSHVQAQYHMLISHTCSFMQSCGSSTLQLQVKSFS